MLLKHLYPDRLFYEQDDDRQLHAICKKIHTHMLQIVEQTKQEFIAELDKAENLQQLEQVRIRFLARSGAITGLFEGLKTAMPTDKPVFGKALNELRQFAQAQFDQKKDMLERASRPKEIPFDITLPGRPKSIGTKHPISHVMEEIKRIFVSMGIFHRDWAGN